MTRNNVVGLSGRRPETRTQVLERLLAEHGEALRAFLRVRMRLSSEDREDIEHDVVVRLANMQDLEHILREESRKIRSFIIKVANNLILDLERRRQVRQSYFEHQSKEDCEQQGLDVSPEAAVQAEEGLAQTREVLMSMKPKWRDAFILHRFGNKSYREISAEMGASVKQVEHYIKQAVIRLTLAAEEIRSR